MAKKFDVATVLERETPFTIEATSARVVPHIMRACWLPVFGATETLFPSIVVSTVTGNSLVTVICVAAEPQLKVTTPPVATAARSAATTWVGGV